MTASVMASGFTAYMPTTVLIPNTGLTIEAGAEAVMLRSTLGTWTLPVCPDAMTGFTAEGPLGRFGLVGWSVVIGRGQVAAAVTLRSVESLRWARSRRVRPEQLVADLWYAACDISYSAAEITFAGASSSEIPLMPLAMM
jgi:hypothetical protein